jgi:ParB family chromosome partitioning protein
MGGLCEAAKAALAEGSISLSQAEAMTLGSDEVQQGILEEIEGGSGFSADEIKTALLDDRPTVALAIFSVEQ